MNLGIRAILYSARKWKKTLLVFFLLLAITTLVLSGLAIADAQEEQSEELRGVTGASFTVNANNGYMVWAISGREARQNESKSSLCQAPVSMDLHRCSSLNGSDFFYSVCRNA